MLALCMRSASATAMAHVEPAAAGHGWWQGFLLAPVMYSAWASPLELAVERAATLPLLAMDLAVDVIFAVDIAVSSFVACLHGSSATDLFVDDRKKVAMGHLTGRPWLLAMDVASTIPFQVIYHLASGRSTAWLSPCRFIFRRSTSASSSRNSCA